MNKQNEICQPIKSAIEILKSQGCCIVSSELKDYHFNQFEIKLTSNKSIDISTLVINNIELLDYTTLNCKCHWSTIHLKNNKDEETITNVIPIDWYELIIETNHNHKYSFDPNELDLYKDFKFLAYPDKLKNFEIIGNEINWNEGYKISLNEIRKNCKLLTQETLKKKLLTLSSRNNAPTDKHTSHHVYSVHLKPYNSDQLFCLAESIVGGLGDMGGGYYYSLDKLKSLENWKNHFIKSDCEWAIKIIESSNSKFQIIRMLIMEYLQKNKRKR